MRLLWLVSWPYARKHVWRTLLTGLAIVIGTSVFVSMHAANRAVLAAFEDTVTHVAGAADLQITAGDIGFEEAVLERVQALDQVRAAVPIVEAVVSTGVAGEGNLLVLGVDLTGDRKLREYDLAAGDADILDDPLLFLAQPDSIIVGAEFASRNQLALGSRIALDAVDGRRHFTIRGILRSRGLTSAFGGNLAIMDVYAAQFVFGRGRRFDRIDIGLAPGVSLGDAQAGLRSTLGSGFQVEPPGERAQHRQSMLRIYRFMLDFSSSFALVVGMFIVYNAFAIAVTERRGEIGLLRALGATRTQVALLFLGESLLLALVGSALGVVFGHQLGGLVARSAASFVRDVYGVSSGVVPVAFTPTVAMIAVTLGMAVSGLAALLPASQAARVDPAKALQKGRSQALSPVNGRGRSVTALLLAVMATAVHVAADSLPTVYVAYACAMVAALLLTPALALWLTRAIRPALARVWPVEGKLAVDSLIAAPGRTAATVSALMLALALVIGLAGSARAFYGEVQAWVVNYLNPDFFVSGSPTLTDRTYRFPDSMTAELQSISGIAEVQRVRHPRVDVDGTPVVLVATELARMIGRSRLAVVEGDRDEMLRLATTGRGVIASESFATMHAVRVGHRIDLPTPSGAVGLPLVGIIKDYADQQGSLIIDRELFVERWGDDTVDFFRVYLAPGAAPQPVRAAILSRFADNRRVFVLTNGDLRDYVTGLTEQWFRMTWIQVAVAILVAILGIVNSLTVSITDRRRELGVLRALGGHASQVRWAIGLEALSIGLVSLVLGLALGAVHLYFVLELAAHDFFGIRLAYLYPYTMAAALFPMILTTAVLGAWGPAEAAVRASLVEALEYE